MRIWEASGAKRKTILNTTNPTVVLQFYSRVLQIIPELFETFEGDCGKNLLKTIKSCKECKYVLAE